MPETTAEPKGVGGRPLPDEKIVIPHMEVQLANGKRVLVAPWGMKEGALVLERLDAISPRLFGGEVRASDLLGKAYDEVVDLVSLSVGVSREEMEKPPTGGGWTFEDLLRVTDAVLEVCVIRSDGRGALPLLLDLVTKMGSMITRSAAPVLARAQSSGSATKATSRASSGNGSVPRSRSRKKRPGSRKS